MSHQVAWLPKAERQPAEIWTASADRVAITKAARELDREIATSGIDAGESRESDEIRVVMVKPLVATVHVNEQQQKAAVVSVRQMRANP